MNKLKLIIILIGGIIIAGLISLIVIKVRKQDNLTPEIENPSPIQNPTEVNETNEFDYKMIRMVNSEYKDNYMISPLSIAYALSILNEGAKDNTKVQIDKVLNNYKLVKNVNVKNRISLANGLFIRNIYKNDISNNYINTLKNNYFSDILFDEFNTPKVLNDWVNDKTYKMIPKVTDSLSKDFVLAIANAIAIDVEWKHKFECLNTKRADFTKKDNTKMDASMMHSYNDVAYLENKNAKGIIKDYAIYDKETGNIVHEENENTVSLQYIAILPNASIDEYINKLDKIELNNLINTKKYADSNLDINLSLPKYTYDFDYETFKNALIKMGITDVFDENSSNLRNMLNDDSILNLYVDKAIHKSHIELSENGTKAAAVTAFIVNKASSIPMHKETINIKFDRPFIYLIKEKNSDNIWFFGTVYEPMKYENDKSSCKIN